MPLTLPNSFKQLQQAIEVFVGVVLDFDAPTLQARPDLHRGKSPKQKVIFSHSVYQYLERRYGIAGMSVHWEPEEVPDEEMWDEFKHILDHHPAKWMIWEGEPDTGTVAKLEKIGIKSVVFNPCGKEPEMGDFLTVMKDNIKALQKIYGK